MSDSYFDLDKISDFLGGTLDKVVNGVSTYYESRAHYDQAKATLANNNQNAQTLSDLENGTGGITSWTLDNDGAARVNFSSPQTILVVAAVALAGFALLKAR